MFGCHVAGAIYGIGGLNPAFVENLQQWDDGDVAARAYLLHFMGQNAAPFPQVGAHGKERGAAEQEQAVDATAD